MRTSATVIPLFPAAPAAADLLITGPIHSFRLGSRRITLELASGRGYEHELDRGHVRRLTPDEIRAVTLLLPLVKAAERDPSTIPRGLPGEFAGEVAELDAARASRAGFLSPPGADGEPPRT